MPPPCPASMPGDATTVPFKQIIISMGAGATAALGAFDYPIRNPAPEAQATQADAVTAQDNRRNKTDS